MTASDWWLYGSLCMSVVATLRAHWAAKSRDAIEAELEGLHKRVEACERAQKEASK